MRMRKWACKLGLCTLFASLSYTVQAEPRYDAERSTSYRQSYPGGALTLTLTGPDIVRVALAPTGADLQFKRVPIVLPQPPCSSHFVIRRLSGHTELRTSHLLIRVYPNSSRVEFNDTAGNSLSGDGSGLAVQDGMLTEQRAIGPREQFFGLGLLFHSFAQRGTSKRLKVNADAPRDTGDSHCPVPFLLSTKGYGIFLDSHGYTRWDVGAADPNLLTVQSPDPVMDFYFCYGPSFHALLAHYTQLTGRMELPPKWGLGFLYRMKSDWKQAKVEEVAQGFRDRYIPCDVIGLEPAWQTHSYPCSYLWSPGQFPDPAGFMNWMKARNFHVNLWEHAYVHESSPIYLPLQQAGAVADKRVWSGLIPDFTLAPARGLFSALHIKEHISLGVDGYKLDECDGSDFTGGWFFPDDTRFPSGLTGAQMHNVFGLLYQKAFHEMFDKMDRRAYLLCRGMFAGAQHYSSVIYSDYYGLPEYIRAAVNSGFSGVLWCPEVRQTASADEFVRRIELVFFSPMAMINAWADGVTPWEKGPEVEAIFRQYDTLRMQLLPYIYSAFWNMHQTGLPVIRALVVDSPHDTNTYSVDDEFMFGPDLLAAPVLHGTQRSIYLPAGQAWVDWWTGTRYNGGQRLDYDAPLARMPLFVRAGAILPMRGGTELAVPLHTLTLRMFPTLPHAKGEAATVYDDDGDSLDYRKGIGAVIRASWSAAPRGLLLALGRRQGPFRPSWHTVEWVVSGIDKPPVAVRLNGTVLAKLPSGGPGSQAQGYSYTSSTRTLTVRQPYLGDRRTEVHVDQ